MTVESPLDYLQGRVTPTTVQVPSRLLDEAAGEGWAGSDRDGRAREIVDAVWHDVIGDVKNDPVRLGLLADASQREVETARRTFDLALKKLHAVRHLKTLDARGDKASLYIQGWEQYQADREQPFDDLYVFDWRGVADQHQYRELALLKRKAGAPKGGADTDPVPLDDWLDAARTEYSKHLLSAPGPAPLDRVEERARELALKAHATLEVREIRASTTAALADLSYAVGARTLANRGPKSDRPLVEIEVGESSGRPARLRLNRSAVVVAAVDLIHGGSALGWKEAHDILAAEVEEGAPGAELAYATADNLRQAASRTYSVKAEEARVRGRDALGSGVLEEAEAWL